MGIIEASSIYVFLYNMIILKAERVSVKSAQLHTDAHKLKEK